MYSSVLQNIHSFHSLSCSCILVCAKSVGSCKDETGTDSALKDLKNELGSRSCHRCWKPSPQSSGGSNGRWAFHEQPFNCEIQCWKEQCGGLQRPVVSSFTINWPLCVPLSDPLLVLKQWFSRIPNAGILWYRILSSIILLSSVSINGVLSEKKEKHSIALSSLLLEVSPCTKYLISLHLSFFFCKMEMITVLTLREFLGGLNVLIIVVRAQWTFAHVIMIIAIWKTLDRNVSQFLPLMTWVLHHPPCVLYFCLLSSLRLLDFLPTWHTSQFFTPASPYFCRLLCIPWDGDSGSPVRHGRHTCALLPAWAGSLFSLPSIPQSHQLEHSPQPQNSQLAQ